MEIVLREGDYRAVVTFMPLDEVRDHLEECLWSAVIAARRGGNDREVLYRMLRHVDQRVRFDYVLGSGPWPDEDDDKEDQDGLWFDEEAAVVDLSATNELLESSVRQLRSIAARIGGELERDLKVNGPDDARVVEELFEEEIEKLLHEDEEFQEVADLLDRRGREALRCPQNRRGLADQTGLA